MSDEDNRTLHQHLDSSGMYKHKVNQLSGESLGNKGGSNCMGLKYKLLKIIN